MPVSHAAENSSSYPIASLIKRLLQLFRDGMDEKLRPWGVTAAQLHVLAKLDYEPGISGARLARACMVTPQTTQVLLRGIEQNGWIRRTKHPENDRILLATLTPSGKRILAKSRTAVGQVYDQMLDGLAAKDVRVLDALLTHCATNLDPVRTTASPSR